MTPRLLSRSRVSASLSLCAVMLLGLSACGDDPEYSRSATTATTIDASPSGTEEHSDEHADDHSEEHSDEHSEAPAGEESEAPDGDASDEPTSSPAGGVPVTDVRIVSATNAGGTVARRARPADDPQARAAVLRGVDAGLRQQVRAAVAELQAPVQVAVVAIGCDVPADVTAEQADDGRLVLTPVFEGERKPECFAPVTSVAVVSTAA